jgi:Cft2 family RNA processing exonuclease
MKIIHHGGSKGVTGSCHELIIDHDRSVLIDCGLFQGNDVSKTQTETEQVKIDFPIENIKALIITHCHIDHVGRLTCISFCLQVCVTLFKQESFFLSYFVKKITNISLAE